MSILLTQLHLQPPGPWKQQFPQGLVFLSREKVETPTCTAVAFSSTIIISHRYLTLVMGRTRTSIFAFVFVILLFFQDRVFHCGCVVLAVLELALVEQAGLQLTEIHLPLPLEFWE